MLGDLRKKTKITFQGKFNDDDLILEDDDFEVEKIEKYDKVREIISSMGDPCKRILELFYFNKLPNEEIAEIMGYNNAKTVKNLKYKCIQRIKKLIEE